MRFREQVYTQNQKKKLSELYERNRTINEIVTKQIDNPDSPILLELILELKYNNTLISKLKIEAKKAYLKEKLSVEQDRERAERYRRIIEVHEQRILILSGILQALNAVDDLLKTCKKFGKELSI